MNDRQWVELHFWAEKTTTEWTAKASVEWKRSLRRKEMATLRKKKKIRLQHMQDELQALEISDEGKHCQAVLRLALESESLRTENTELHSKLQLHGRMHH
ncbi:hypothetical protein GQ600_9381 [Phytophthora cactorum]|nr:hypothetical protein GQ600_9381 [Phytophthora cactorum]